LGQQKVGGVERTDSRSSRGDQADVASVRLFTLADARHFPGVVALVNSLRLHGHREPVTVLDLGFEPEQRAVLEGECDIVSPPEHSPRHPWLLEPHACMAREAEIVVYVDADIVLTGRLDGVLRAARAGKVLLFADIMVDRQFDEWQEIFELRGPLRRQTYANAGFMAFSTLHFPQLLARWAECCERLVGQATYLDTKSFDSPTALSSQDALNAILMSEIAAAHIDIQPAETAAQGQIELTHTRVVDVTRLRCERNGRAVALLHAWGALKPWDPAARASLRRSAYLTCLRRLLVGSDVAVRAPLEALPSWLQAGARGRWSLWYLTQARRPWRGVRERGKGLAEQFASRLRR
jgi:hypothetical protein